MLGYSRDGVVGMERGETGKVREGLSGATATGAKRQQSGARTRTQSNWLIGLVAGAAVAVAEILAKLFMR